MMRAHRLLFFAALCSAAHAAHAGEWRYVVPAEDDVSTRAPEMPLLLSPEAPEGLEVAVVPRSGELLFAQIRYGDAGSVRIAVALDEKPGEDPILYVDANRDRRLEPGERVAAGPSGWRTTLTISEGPLASSPSVAREVSFRLGHTRMVLGYATLGWVEGRLDVGGRECTVRRVDGDGNGFLTDAHDPIWIDLDGDGKWSPFEEQFLFAPVLRVGDARYALHSDRLGGSLTSEKVEGVGHIRLLMTAADGKPRKDVLALQVVLSGKDGTAVGVIGHDVPIEAPIGDYRITTVNLTLADAKKGAPWSYVFSEGGRKGDAVWHHLDRDAEIVLDPIGALQFEGGLDPHAGRMSGGSSFLVKPRLYTGDGLLVNTTYRGTSTSGYVSSPRARIALQDRAGNTLVQSDSGFA